MTKVARRDLENKGYTISVKTGTNAGHAERQTNDGEFARFENLTAKLVKVPKAELHEKLKES